MAFVKVSFAFDSKTTTFMNVLYVLDINPNNIPSGFLL